MKFNIRTWHIESLICAILLGSVTYFCTSGEWVDWLTTAAVLLTFNYTSVASRLDESQERIETKHGVECRQWLVRYLIGKEFLWMLVFLLSGLYPALVGNFIFLVYPFWRRWWVAHR